MNDGFKVPNHLAIIPDGNRRWSKLHDMPVWKGHWKGGEVVDNLFDWCIELGIPNVSLWVGSTENLRVRSKKEITELFKVYQHFLEKWEKKESILDRYQVKVRFIGDIEKLPKELVNLIGNIMSKTAKYQRQAFNVLINYGGKFELLNVMKKLASVFVKAGRIEINEKVVEKNLMVPIPVDLIVRTGGYSRISNFMLWQSSYAELIFLNKMWPDFTKKDLVNCIKEFNRRQRNFGK